MVLCLKKYIYTQFIFYCRLWWVLISIQMGSFSYVTPSFRAVMRSVQCIMVLTVKRNDPVSLSKPKATRGRENKKAGNNHAVSVFRMLWNCLEDSTEFYSPVMDIKTGTVPEGVRIGSSRLCKAILGLKVRVGVFTRWFQKETTDSEEEYTWYLLGALAFPPPSPL